MKKLFFIFAFLPLFVSGQTLNLNNNQIKFGGDTAVVVDGNLKADTIFSKNCHADTLVFSDGTKQSTAATGGGASYLVYVALISQSGTSAPTSTVLENTTGSVFTWVYDDVGYYILQSSDSIFSENKMTVNVSFWPTYDGLTVDNKLKVAGYNGYDNAAKIWFTSFMFYNSTVEYSNNCFLNTYLEIRFYP